MAHAQDLPENAVHYRFRKECATKRDWLDAIRPEERVLDLGCGAGAWTERFAEHFGGVIAIEQSATMLAAARTRLAWRLIVTGRFGTIVAITIRLATSHAFLAEHLCYPNTLLIGIGADGPQLASETVTPDLPLAAHSEVGERLWPGFFWVP